MEVDEKKQLANLRARWQQYRDAVGTQEAADELGVGDEFAEVPVLVQQAQMALMDGNDADFAEIGQQLVARLDAINHVLQERHIAVPRRRAPTAAEVQQLGTMEGLRRDLPLPAATPAHVRAATRMAARLVAQQLREQYQSILNSPAGLSPGAVLPVGPGLEFDDEGLTPDQAHERKIRGELAEFAADGALTREQIEQASELSREYTVPSWWQREQNRLTREAVDRRRYRPGMSSEGKTPRFDTPLETLLSPSEQIVRDAIRAYLDYNTELIGLPVSPGNALGQQYEQARLEQKLNARREAHRREQDRRRAQANAWKLLSQDELDRWGLSGAQGIELTELVETLQALAESAGTLPGEEENKALAFAANIVADLRDPSPAFRLRGVDHLVELRYPELAAITPRGEDPEKRRRTGSAFLLRYRKRRRKY